MVSSVTFQRPPPHRVAVSRAIHTKLYGLAPESPDEQTAETYARLLLDGARGGTSAGR